MRIILKRDVDELGLEGDIVEVAKGHARNHLFPKGFAVEATQENIKALESQRKKIEVKRLKAKEDAQKVKERVEALEAVFQQRAGEEGKLYGSITSMDIAAYLEKQGVVVDRRKIALEKPIKTLGEFQIPVRIYPGVTGSVRVVVLPEGRSES